MKGVTIAMILLTVLLLCAIIFVIVSAYLTMQAKKTCESQESPYCLSIECPCDNNVAPCNGYASRNGEQPNTYYCSSAPDTLVDQDGNIVS